MAATCINRDAKLKRKYDNEMLVIGRIKVVMPVDKQKQSAQ